MPEDESDRAAALYEELDSLSSEERLARLKTEPRFWRPALARLLLKAAGQAKDPRQATALAEEAETIGHQAADRCGRAVCDELLSEVSCVQAEAAYELGSTSTASLTLDFAARYLHGQPLTSPARARFCFSAAVVQSRRGLVDEALALLDRAEKLWGEAREPGRMGEVHTLRGWLCLDHGEPELALTSLQVAARLLDVQDSGTACKARCGVALAQARLGRMAEAEHALEQAFARLPPEEETPSLSRLRAAVLERLGRTEEAIERLGRIRQRLIEEDAVHDALIVSLDIARLQMISGQMSAAEETLRTTVGRAEWAELSLRVRAGLSFVARFSLRRRSSGEKLLVRAIAYLERPGRYADLGFDTGQPLHASRDWEDLDLPTRRQLCEEAGLASTAAELPGTELDLYSREMLRLAFEEVAQFHLTFEREAEEPF